jgi:hypothetical protein
MTHRSSGATVLGLGHRLRDTNAQDAFAIAEGSGLVAVVCDGCGSAPRSEVGAALLASAVRRAGLEGLAAGVAAAEVAMGLGDAACAALAGVTRTIAGEPASAPGAAFVHDHLLATMIALVDDGETLAITAWGDGLVALDGAVFVLGEGDAPAYLAYSLIDGAPAPAPSWCFRGPSAAIARAAIATDGVDAAWIGGAFGHRGRGLARWLNVQARRRELLDDATVVVREREVTS